MSDTKPLTERLEIKAMMIQMGERIAYGSDSGIMHEAVAALKKLAAERDALQAENERLTQDRDEWRDSTIAANANAASEEKRRREMQDQRDQLKSQLDAMGKGEPVQFLCDATRFKVRRHEGDEASQIFGLPRELNGRWVALVAADDDCHLKLAAPKALAPLKWAPEEIEDGMRGIRWVMPEGVFGRPTDHDVREYLLRTETARGCHCDDCKAFYGIGGTP